MEIWLLGGFRMRWRGEPWEALKPGKAQLLLAYLLLHRERDLPRSRVAAALWPDSSEEQARTNLRRELHALRAALPSSEFLRVDSRQLGWRGGWTDVAEFESAEPARAVELYTGELLPGFYDEWLLEARDRLAERYRLQLEKLAAQREACHEWLEALAAARRLVALDPLDEAAHRRVIRLCLAAGDRPAARRALSECERRLREELEVAPSPATLELLREPSAVQVTGTPLWGRERELAALRQWPSDRFLLVSGEPGIGKTRLLQELGPALWARGFEAERSRPFGAWLEALRGHADARQLLCSPSEGPARDVLFDPLVEWLRSRAPLTLVMDDLQWFDESSLALLHYAARLLLGNGLRFAGTVRTAEVGPGLREVLLSLRRSGLLFELVPQPLDGEAVSRLVASVAPQRDAGTIAERCGGNPLFALELARSEQEGWRACIEERLTRLSGPAREIVCWAAALGRSFSPDRLEKILGRGLLELLPSLEELEKHQILRPLACDYDFSHDVVRELAYEQLSPPRRRLIHRQIALILQAHPEHWADVPRHAALGGEPQLAARASLQAAQQSLRLLAFKEAADFARLGLQQTSEPEVRLELLRAELLAGVTAERGQQLQSELETLLSTQPELRSAAYEALSALAYDLRQDQAVEAYSLRLAESARHSPAAESARWLAHSASCLAAIGRDLPRCAALLREAEELARRCQLQLIDIPLCRGLLELHAGQTETARKSFWEALELSRRLQEPWWRGQCLVTLGRLTLESGDWAQAEAIADELEEVIPRLGEGCESFLALALRRLRHNQDLEDVLGGLRRMDAKRMLAFMGRIAAARAWQTGLRERALALSAEALAAARAVQHLDEIVLCGAQWLEYGGDPAELTKLRRETRGAQLSAAARAALRRAARRLKRSPVCP